MCYKLGLEFFNGSITTLATDRFKATNAFTKRELDSVKAKPSPILTRQLVGAAQGVNQAAQCVGAIMIAPLVKRWPTRTVLSFAILTFGLMTTILLIVDAATGVVTWMSKLHGFLTEHGINRREVQGHQEQ
jgi:uncharacterized membrane protein